MILVALPAKPVITGPIIEDNHSELSGGQWKSLQPNAVHGKTRWDLPSYTKASSEKHLKIKPLMCTNLNAPVTGKDNYNNENDLKKNPMNSPIQKCSVIYISTTTHYIYIINDIIQRPDNTFHYYNQTINIKAHNNK